MIKNRKHKSQNITWIKRAWFFLQGVKNFYFDFITKKQDIAEIPIIINNRNRLTYLTKLLDSIEKRGYKNIIILDNDSTYPPLLDYYQICPFNVVYLKENLGYKALSKIDLFEKIRKGYYVYSDPDVLPIAACPDDFLTTFLTILKKHPTITKVGFSLKIDDLPDHYEKKQQVIEHEKQFWEKKIGDNLYYARIDTTFALHRPHSRIGTYRAKMVRVGYPYQLHHLPWYNDSANLSEEEKFYIQHAVVGGHWTNGDPHFKRN